jgi:phosphoesterase RecJ-like protein
LNAIPTADSGPEGIREIIRRHGRFILTTHVNPDGDGLGSELALRDALAGLGKDVSVINHSPTPSHYLWLDPAGVIGRYSGAAHGAAIAGADAILILDTNQPDRLRSMEEPVRASRAVRAVIDHHMDPHPFADAYYVDTGATSTGEMVYRLLRSMEEVTITPAIAVALYTAIMTDTGSFRYPRTGAFTHEIAADLVGRGADPTAIFAAVYETWTPGRMRLLGEALDTLSLSGGGAIASMLATREMFGRTGTTEVETDTFTTYPMNIVNVRIGILFTELADGVKISFRSKGTIPVNELAKEFGGNGHLNASGARLHGVSLGEAVPMVLEAAGKYIDHGDTTTQTTERQ